jgi:predicted dehydrogenase
MLSILVVGAGTMGTAHARSYQAMEKVKLAGIADENEERGEKAANRFKTMHYSSYKELLEQNIDAVIVASENVNHRKHVFAAAKAKKHVLCEKPLATTIEDGQDMNHVCTEYGVKLQIAFPVRFNTPILRFWGDSMDAELVKGFVRNIVEDREPTISGDDGLKAVEAALSAYQSSKSHEPVRIR